MVGHVADFGLARVLHQDHSVISEKSSGWATMRGTIGYAAPGMFQPLKLTKLEYLKNCDGLLF